MIYALPDRSSGVSSATFRDSCNLFKPLASLWSTEEVARLKNDSKKMQSERRASGAEGGLVGVCLTSVYSNFFGKRWGFSGDEKRAPFLIQLLCKCFQRGASDFPSA